MASTVYGYGRGRAGGRRATGVAGVVVFHAVVVYALISGLAQDAVKKIQQKVEVSIISEPPPPPPPPTPPPKVEKVVPKAAPPVPQPKAYVPPVEHPAPAPAPAAIIATTSDPAPQPPAPPPEPAAPAPAPSGPVSAKGNCTHIEPPKYPDRAQDEGIAGHVEITFQTGADGKLSGTPNLSFKGIPVNFQKYFRNAVTTALQSYTCSPNLQLKQVIGFELSSDS